MSAVKPKPIESNYPSQSQQNKKQMNQSEIEQL